MGRFLLVDLALSGALECLKSLLEWLMTYDVGCSYLKNILVRWKEGKLPHHLEPIVKRLRVLLPQLHMLAHKDSCQTEFAVCYTSGAGHTNGEAVEPLWATHNQAGPSTREMNGGARHDALNDMFSFWNWVKHETMGELPPSRDQPRSDLVQVNISRANSRTSCDCSWTS